MKKVLFTICLLTIVLPFCKAQTNVASLRQCSLKIEFVGEKYEDIKMYIDDNLFNNQRTIVKGVPDNNGIWLFTFDEGIYDKHSTVHFVSRVADDKVYRDVVFETVSGDNRSLSISFEKKSEIKCQFKENKTTPYREGEQRGYSVFTIDKNNEDIELMLSLTVSGFNSFTGSKVNLEYMKKDQKLIRKYPNSHYLMSMLAYEASHYYKSKRHLIALYYCFSEENRESFLGKKVKYYIQKE